MQSWGYLVEDDVFQLFKLLIFPKAPVYIELLILLWIVLETSVYPLDASDILDQFLE